MSKGVSLHIGLNHVDPAHYGGWDGQLRACVNDATCMHDLAATLGYEANMLLDEAATAANVRDAIAKVAGSLGAGDTFLLTYAGHGGQVPDIDGDEARTDTGEIGERQDAYDETWLLFDRMLIDDELYELFGRFAAGTRVVVLSDSCHSGTVTREPRVGVEDAGADAEWVSRRAPMAVEDRTYAANKALYDAIQRETPARDSASIAAGVVLISGCQDDQTSGDGRRNGRFTGTLLRVWGPGEPLDGNSAASSPFAGNLHDLWSKIKQQMPAEQVPNYYLFGAADADLDERAALVF
jgi:hypothetical protein